MPRVFTSGARDLACDTSLCAAVTGLVDGEAGAAGGAGGGAGIGCKSEEVFHVEHCTYIVVRKRKLSALVFKVFAGEAPAPQATSPTRTDTPHASAQRRLSPEPSD